MLNAKLIGKFAYTAVVVPEGFILGRADYGTKGYTPVRIRPYSTWDQAREAANKLNSEEGLTPVEAQEIVFNTMG